MKKKIDLHYTTRILSKLKCSKMIEKAEIIEDVSELPLGVYPANEYLKFYSPEQLKSTVGYVHIYDDQGEFYSSTTIDEITKANGYDIRILKISIKGDIAQYYAVAEKYCNSADFTGYIEKGNEILSGKNLYICAVYEATTPNTAYPVEDKMKISYSTLTNGTYEFTSTVISSLDNIIDFYSYDIYTKLYANKEITMTKLKDLFKLVKKAFNSMTNEQLVTCSGVNIDMSCSLYIVDKDKKEYKEWLANEYRDEDVVNEARHKTNVVFYGNWDIDFVKTRNEFIKEFIWMDWFEGKDPFKELKYATFSVFKVKRYYITLLTYIYKYDIYIHYMD